MSITVLVAATTTRLTTVGHVLTQLPSADVAQVDALIAAASAAIAQHTHRVWARETVQETLTGTGTRYLGLSRTPLLTVGTVTEDSTTITDWSVDDADAGRLYRANGWAPGLARGWDAVAYSSGYITPDTATLRYVATYQAGYVLPVEAGTPTPTLPADVEQAAIETVKAWQLAVDRDPTITRIAVGDVNETYGQGAAAAVLARTTLPPLAAALLRPWVRAPFEPGR